MSLHPDSIPRMSPTPPAAALELNRALGWIGAGALLAGSVIGTGIFLVPSTIAREIGSVPGVFFIWVFGGLLSLAGALSYAELGAAYPEAGGEYVYLRRAYGPVWGFLYGWQQIAIGKTGSIASIATGFALFLGFFFPQLGADLAGAAGWNLSGIQAVALSAVILLTAVNYLGIAVGGTVQTILTALKVAAILSLAALALSSGRGSWSDFSVLPAAAAGHVSALGGFFAALSAALWAYDGWNNVNMVAGEVRDPQRVIPRVLTLGIVAVIAVYLLINLAYFYVLPLAEIQQSTQVAQSVADRLFGSWGAGAITVAALVSTLAALNGAILSGARVSYAMACDGLFFRHMADLSPGHRTPAKALLLQGLFACGLILVFGRDKLAFERLFNFAIFGMWGFYGITALAVLVLRRRQPFALRPYHVPGYPWVPLCFVAVAAAFCASMLVQRPQETSLGIALLVGGLPFYWFWRWGPGNGRQRIGSDGS